jgi:hypothetical protein
MQSPGPAAGAFAWARGRSDRERVLFLRRKDARIRIIDHEIAAQAFEAVGPLSALGAAARKHRDAADRAVFRPWADRVQSMPFRDGSRMAADGPRSRASPAPKFRDSCQNCAACARLRLLGRRGVLHRLWPAGHSLSLGPVLVCQLARFPAAPRGLSAGRSFRDCRRRKERVSPR